MRATIALILFAAGGCTSSGVPGGGDAGLPDNDGAVKADLAGSSCGQISAAVDAWVAAHQGCTVDQDCTVLTTACGIQGACGEFANVSASGAYLQSLLDAWAQQMCGPAPNMCACPAEAWAQPGCNAGVCGPKMLGSGEVGAACANGSDCMTGQCATPLSSKLFVGGYCTVFDCNTALQDPCPTGSACKPGGDGHSYCLKDCNPFLNTQQCRQGYACCSGAGPQGMEGWCSPQNSGLCLAQ